MIGVSDAVVEKRLEDLVFVRIDGSLDDVLAESPRGIDQHDVVETRFGIDREHHAGAAEVGAHHLSARRSKAPLSDDRIPWLRDS